jgi:alkylhydroperoxidase/carboxymuconolactone decarboxylase family protein YurZ
MVAAEAQGGERMTTREGLRRDGAALRARLFAAETPRGPEAEIAPGLADLFDELIFGGVWSRPGLALPDRMIAALAALCAVQRLAQLRRHAAAALDLGLSAQAIVEIFIQCGIYAGFPASEEAIGIAAAVFAERGLSLPVAASRPASLDDADSLDKLMARGRALLEELHGRRGYEGYAAPDNAVTGALYPIAIQYGYGEIWHRPGLDRRQRALCAVAAFTALRLEGQVRKFGQSALNAGLRRTEIIEAVIHTGPYSGLAPALNALAALSDVLSG